MSRCERCGARPPGEYALHDYCAACLKNLCADCMEAGCCGVAPAASGQEADDAPPCPECLRTIGHKRDCPRRPARTP